MPEKYDPSIHHRRSIRIPSYDYSQDGWYFVTICTQNRKDMFGTIVGAGQCACPILELNNAGFMVKTWWQKVRNKFPSVQTDEYVVMPNHFHGIINIAVGATPCGRPNLRGRPTLCSRPDPDVVDGKSAQTHNELGQSHRIAPTLGDIVNWFKTMTTNRYIHGVKQNDWPPFSGRLWQRNYYEHIIRKEDELNRFRCYIADNPANWQTDRGKPRCNPVGAALCARPNLFCHSCASRNPLCRHCERPVRRSFGEGGSEAISF